MCVQALTIRGSNFGASGAAFTVHGQPCVLGSFGQTQSSFICNLPAGQGRNIKVIGTVSFAILNWFKLRTESA